MRGAQLVFRETLLRDRDERIPAASPACTPFTASSITTQPSTVAPNLRAAASKMSGAGFLCTTSSAETTASHHAGGSPIWL